MKKIFNLLLLFIVLCSSANNIYAEELVPKISLKQRNEMLVGYIKDSKCDVNTAIDNFFKNNKFEISDFDAPEKHEVIIDEMNKIDFYPNGFFSIHILSAQGYYK